MSKYSVAENMEAASAPPMMLADIDIRCIFEAPDKVT